MKKNLKIFIAVLVVVLLVQACAVGPNYRTPETKSKANYRYSTNSENEISLKWWEIFNDPILDTLIVEALRANKNVLIAASRIEQARANVKFNKADQLPKFGVSGTALRGDYIQGIQLQSPTSSFGATSTVNWELDFWGKYRRTTEASRAELLASFYAKRAIEIGLISEVASNYFKLLDYRARLEISESTLALRNNTLEIIQARFDAGYTHIIDVNQAQIQKAITEVSVPQYKRLVAFSEHNLSVLLGKNPDSFPTEKSLKDYALPNSIPTGIPSAILQRRPDILQAAQNYRIQNAYIGVAQAMRFPSIGLTGLLGLGSNDLSDLVSNGLGWSVGGSITAPIFEFGKNARRVDIERERAKQSLYSYENTVLNALMEVDNALIELSTLRDELNANERMTAAASNASYLSQERYFYGETSYLEVIENQRQEFEARLSYSLNYQELLNSYVNLYKSLGGGWVSQAEINKLAQQLADEKGVDVSTIDKDALFYSGQVVDLVLSDEEMKARKQAKKEQQKLERIQKRIDKSTAN